MRRIQHLLFHKTRILLMSMLFVLCMFALPVHAEEPGGDIRFTEPGQDYNVSFDDAPQYKGQKISFTLYNDSSVCLRLDINMQFQRTSAWSDELLADFRQNSIRTYAIFEPGESAQFSLDFRSDYAGGTSISIHTSESEIADVGGTAVKGNGRVFKASFQWRDVCKEKQNIDIGSYSQNTDAKGYDPFVKKKIVLK